MSEIEDRQSGLIPIRTLGSASGGYRPIGSLTSDHSSRALTGIVPENERAGVWLLKKVVGDLYVLGGV